MTDIAPAFEYIQQESVQFNNPVSESSGTAMGGSINALLSVVLPVGSVIHSMLSEAQFQTAIGSTNWVLADGRTAAGSGYNSVTGFSNIPDLRGIFLRGKSYSNGTNPDGDLAVGTLQAQSFLGHGHPITDPGHGHGVPGYQAGGTTSVSSQVIYSPLNVATFHQVNVDAGPTGITVDTEGGNETRPINITVNIFIRLN